MISTSRLAFAAMVGAVAVTASSCASSRSSQRPAAPTDVAEDPRQEGPARFQTAFAVVRSRSSTGAHAWWRTVRWFLAGTPDEADEDGELVRPFDVEPDPEGGFVVADPDLASVIRYGPDGRVQSSVACKALPWIAPMSLALDESGALYVADAGAGVVVRWREGACAVFRSTDLTRPTGVATANGRVFVADPPNHHVVVFSTDGAPLGVFGERGEGDGQLNFPTDVATAPDGSIFVVDALNFRVAHWSQDGRWLGSFGRAGDSNGLFARPKSVHVDRHGHVLVTDAQRDLVLLFGADGTFLSAFGSPGNGPGQFTHPSGISSRGGRLFVADSQNRRVQVFDARGEFP